MLQSQDQKRDSQHKAKLKASEHHEHSPEAIAKRLKAGPSLSYLRDWVYGGIDGAVTTFAVVSGVIGAQLSTRTILILGIANVLADGFSMAAANYLGTKTERDQRGHYKNIEERHIDIYPEGEKEEVRQILKKKGFDGELLEKGTEKLTSDRKRWIDTMLTEEYGIAPNIRSPMRASMSTFTSFLFCGFIPLVPFVFGLPQAFRWAGAFTAIVFFSIGSLKSRWSPISWWVSGLQTLVIGSAAASIAYFAGILLRSIG